MKIGFTAWQRFAIAFACFAIAIAGFMLKLPSGFRHIDKELHATFYFLAAAFLNLLFGWTKIVRHVIIFAALYLFGLLIELGQAYSNRFFRSRIHGRFDPEDVEWNLKGLLAFSFVWILTILAIAVYKKTASKNNLGS